MLTVAERIERRLQPMVDTALDNQPPELLGRVQRLPWERTFSTEPAGNQGRKWVVNITHHLVDDAGNVEPIASIAGYLAGLIAAGEFGHLEYWYLPDPLLDDDIPQDPILLEEFPLRTGTYAAVCERCAQVMRAVDGCAEVDTTYRFGGEPHWDELDLDPPDRCRDCACRQGWYHHAWCTQAACTRCDTQALGCPCDIPHWEP